MTILTTLKQNNGTTTASPTRSSVNSALQLRAANYKTTSKLRQLRYWPSRYSTRGVFSAGTMSSSTTAVIIKKRERTQNWVPEEKSALFNLIKMHVAAIENKKIDAAASALKTLAWQQVYCAFRSRFNTDRDITRMREQWRRMKAQARLEMYNFAEKVRMLGPEEAAKSRPSNLSIEVWRLMESARKHNNEDEISDSSSQDLNARPGNFQTILKQLTVASPSDQNTVHEVKVERNDEGLDEEIDLPPWNQREPLFLQQLHEVHQPKDTEQGTAVTDKKTSDCETNPTFLTYHRNRDCIDTLSNHDQSQLRGENQPETVQKAVWVFEAAQREHELKLRMLNIELERAEVRKQTALNELRTSQLKKQFIESQIADVFK